MLLAKFFVFYTKINILPYRLNRVLDAKSVVLLITGVVIISSVFTAFHVAYPTGNPIIEKIPKTLNQLKLFSQQKTDQNLLGFGKTGFTPSGNETITIEGYARNGTSSIPNQVLYSAVFPEETSTHTSSNGFYQITVLLAGNGTFAFKIPGFNTLYLSLSLFGAANVWQNLSFTPESKYQVSGQTQFPSGNIVPNADIIFTGFFNTYKTASNSSGAYSLELPNGTFQISASKPGFSKTVTPSTINVAGNSIRNQTLTLDPYGNAIFNVSGYVFNELHQPIKGAMVSSNSSPNQCVTNSLGFYKIGVAYGYNSILAIAAGYMPNIPPLQLFVVANMTDQNITLQNASPFSGSGGSQGSGTNVGQGLNGLNGSTTKNITSHLGNNSSNISYGNNSNAGGIMLYGNVTNSANHLPVSNTNLRFYINVNGTYYYEDTFTNGTGHYSIFLNYSGTYFFSVYSPFYYLKNLTVTVKGNTSEDFSLTPYSKYMLTISGTVENAIDSLPIPAVIELNSQPQNSTILYNFTDSSGHYSLNVMVGNYFIIASSPGYNSEIFNITVVNDTVKTFKLTPTSSIGSGAQQWSSSSGTNLPGTNGTSISQAMNKSGSGNATGYKLVLLTVTLYNKSNEAQTINNTYYEAFIGIDGVIYNCTGKTDSSGTSVIALFYTGNYTILIDTVNYNGTPKKLDVTGNMSASFNLTPKALYSLQVMIYNDYPGPGNTNESVPADTLSVTNYKSMGLIYASYAVSSTGTVYNYVIPNGTYDFSYSNANFVPLAFQYNMTGSLSSLNEKATPYLAVIYANSATNWSYSILENGNQIYDITSLGSITSYTNSLNLTQSTFTAEFFIAGNMLVDSKTFSLTNQNPLENLYFNLTSDSTVLISPAAPQYNGGEFMNVTFDFQNPGYVFVYNLSINYTVSPGSLLYINNASKIYMTTSNVSINPYFETSGRNMNMLFEIRPIYYEGYALIPTWPLNLSVHYYTGNLKYLNFGVGA